MWVVHADSISKDSFLLIWINFPLTTYILNTIKFNMYDYEWGNCCGSWQWTTWSRCYWVARKAKPLVQMSNISLKRFIFKYEKRQMVPLYIRQLRNKLRTNEISHYFISDGLSILWHDSVSIDTAIPETPKLNLNAIYCKWIAWLCAVF